MATPKEERTVEIIVNGTKANASLKEMAAAAAVLSNQVAKIAADDPKRAELIAQLQTMRQRIGDARAEIAGLLTTEQQAAAAEQKLAEAIAATAAEQARASAAQQQAIVVGKSGTASYNEMRTAAGLLEKQLHELSADDPGRAALIKDYQSLKTRMEGVREEMGKVVKTEEELRAEQDALKASQLQLVVNGQKVAASMREMREAAAQLEKELNELAHDDPARGPLIASLQELKARIKSVGDEVAGVAETTSHMKQVMTNAFAFAVGGGIEQGIEKVVEMGKSIFDTTAKFETYGKVLANALGSESLAQKALADIQTMAAKTPFSVDELTSSFLKFVNRGLQPSMEEMTKLGDLASSQGKSFDQLAEAVLDAGTGEFERLKEFGISASKSGDQVSLSFKGVNQTVANTPAAINAAIVAFGEVKGVMGGMATISGTLEGQLSNVGDTADQVAVTWGQTLRPVFVAVLSTIGFLLGALGALPGFIKENRGLLLGLAGAVVTLNFANISSTASTLASIAAEKARAIAVRASTAALWLLDAAAAANPFAIMIAAGVVLIGVLVNLYEKSATFRAAVAGMGQALQAFGKTYVQGLIQQFTGLGDIIMGALTLNPERIKKGLTEVGTSLKTIYYDAGKNAAAAYTKGYDEKAATDAATSAAKQANLFDQFAHAYQQRLDAALKARLVAEAAARMEALKNEEAALRLKLAQAKDGSEQEMRLQQQLVTNEAKQQLEDTKKTAGDRAIILAEAEEKRAKLAQEFYEKQAKAQKALRDKADQARLDALKELVKQEEALEDAKIQTIADKREREIAQINLDATRKARLVTGSESEQAEQIVGIVAERDRKLKELAEKYQKEADEANKEYFQKQMADEDAAEVEREAKLQQRFADALDTEAKYHENVYNAKHASLEAQLLLEEAYGDKTTKEYRKTQAELLKLEKARNKEVLDDAKKAQKAKAELAKRELSVASDVLGATLDMLFQDEDARKKHHSLYVALAGAKIVVDGAKEVQAIWQYQADNPLNGETMGTAGIIMGAIQTAIAVARTGVALSKIGATDSSTGGSGYAKGGLTGDGGGLAVSPMGVLMQMSGMSVGSNGRLMDGSGFAVAGVVHEDEYVIPKWQLQDPQVAAVAQWLEARRLRGFADGGATSASSGATLPVAAASPTSDGEKLYAVLTQLLDVNRVQAAQLADVKDWQRTMQVRLDLRATQTGLDTYKQAQLGGAIRSKS